MKKVKYFDKFFMLLFIASIAYFLFIFFSKKTKVNLAKKPSSEIKWQKDSIIDLGFLKTDITYNFSTTLYNAGSYPLYIQNINTSCGCTKAKFSKTEILVNDSAIITGTISTSKSPKDFVVISFRANTNQLNHNLFLSYKTKLQ
jgi:hypothetical protein